MPRWANLTATGGPGRLALRFLRHRPRDSGNPLVSAGGDLYWVSAPMTDLARHAVPSLPTRSLHPHDLPSPAGLMVFEAPLARYLNSECREVEIMAVSWGPWDGPAGLWDQGGTWLTFWSHPAPVLPRAAFAGDAADLAALGPMPALPPVMPDNEAGWPFGNLPAGPTFPRAPPPPGRWSPAGHGASCSSPSPSPKRAGPRGVRRRLACAGLPDTGVRVVRIRRCEPPPAGRRGAGAAAITRSSGGSAGAGGTTGAAPAAPTRGPLDRPHPPEDRWIAPYLAGPDGKPVRGTERVRVWDR
jgi:hypothetical protein